MAHISSGLCFCACTCERVDVGVWLCCCVGLWMSKCD